MICIKAEIPERVKRYRGWVKSYLS